MNIYNEIMKRKTQIADYWLNRDEESMLFVEKTFVDENVS